MRVIIPTARFPRPSIGRALANQIDSLLRRASPTRRKSKIRSTLRCFTPNADGSHGYETSVGQTEADCGYQLTCVGRLAWYHKTYQVLGMFMETDVRTVKQPRAIETRDRILREAAGLFARQGFHDTKVADIIAVAKVTSGAFFHHFAGKDDLGFAVIDHHMGQRRAALDRIEQRMAVGCGYDPLECVFRRLDALCEMVVKRRNRKGGCLIGNLSTALSDTHPAFRKRLAECFDEMALEFRDHLDEAAAQRGFSSEQDTWEIARYIVSVIEGAIMLTRTHRDINMIQRQVKHLKDDLKRIFQTANGVS